MSKTAGGRAWYPVSPPEIKLRDQLSKITQKQVSRPPGPAPPPDTAPQAPPTTATPTNNLRPHPYPPLVNYAISYPLEK